MEDYEPPAKRCRKNLFTDSAPDDPNQNNVGTELNKDQIEREYEEDIYMKKILRRIPRGNYVSSTSVDRTRLYMRLLPSTDNWNKDKLVLNTLSCVKKMLPSIFQELRSKIELERDLELQSKIDFLHGKTLPISEQQKENKKNENKNAAHVLWVEKYKPKCFMELLSDDGTNRTLLRWLKLWDKVVFNKEVKLRPPKEINAGNKFSSKKFTNSSKNFKSNQRSLSEELDALNCPIQKIALLCGPPGLGKTTLAYVIASQAGYNVVEMNASDDRSTEIFRNQIQAATEMKSVFGSERKPNCLIIDEIDGAPLASINVLMSLVNGKVLENSKKSKKESKPKILSRPIICICNNQFASALKPLRLSALVINFPSITSVRLASRLMEITRMENLKTDTSTLIALCGKAENDIRSCISTLQFVTNKQGDLSMKDVQLLACGQKDIQRSLFSVWQSLFQIPKISRSLPIFPNELPVGQQTETKNIFEISRFDKILMLSQGYSEHDKIQQGIFENYPLMKFKDHNMNKCSYGSDWLCFADLLQQEIQHSQNYTVMSYLPFATVALHYTFASTAFPKITFPSAFFQLKTRMASCNNVITNIIDETPPAFRSHVTPSVAILDFLPWLTRIIQPTFRPVNVQLYSVEEKALFDKVIEIMVSLNVNYRQQIEQDGQYNFVLEPRLDVATVFPDAQQQDMSYTSKQAISHEINLMKMRKKEESVRKLAAEIRKEEQLVKKSEHKQPSFSNQKLQPKPVLEKPCMDFFGRVINKSSAKQQRDSAQEQIKGEVWFHFKEGYSNATKLKIRMKDL